MTAYPAQWESDAVLTDGTMMHLRPIRPDDREALVEGFERLSPESVHFRFFSPKKELTERELEHFTRVDYHDRFALVAEILGEYAAVGRWDRITEHPNTAEVAFTVLDEYHGRGIGTLLFEHLAVIARQHGIDTFEATVLADNRKMLRMFRKMGFEMRSERDHETVLVTLPLEFTDDAINAMETRELQAGSRSIARLLRPESVAIVGAGRTRGSVGHEIFRNILYYEFDGPVYPVNPTARHVMGVPAYPTVGDIPDELDLAIVTIPAPGVLDVVDDCAAKGVRGLVVISAGFAETSSEGARLEREVLARARRHGMRMVGPNCLGIVNTDPDVHLNATFAPDAPVRGNAGFMSQSGALGIAILDQASRLGLGISSFVSVGNKADVSGNDLIEYWVEDDDTDVILLYLESFGNPRRFSRIARRVSAEKPIVAVKSGRTTSGTRAASSHTAALASPETAVDALFHQTGVVRVDTLGQLFDVAQVLSHQPLPKGRRVCIVSNAGGPAILAADACEQAGLKVQELSEQTQARLREDVLPGAAVGNPIDLIAAAAPSHFEHACRTVLGDPDVDALIVSYTPPIVTNTVEVAEAVARGVAWDHGKPVLSNFLDSDAIPVALERVQVTEGELSRIPTFAYPEEAAQALVKVARYAEWRSRPHGEEPVFADVDTDAAESLVDRVLGKRPEGGWLDAADAYELLRTYRIPTAATVVVASADEAAEAAARIGGRVALKAAAGDVVHKTDVGALVLGLATPSAVKDAYSEMAGRLGEQMGGGIVQEMVPTGVETIVGVVHDRAFGPLVMFGMGGTTAELLRDRSFRVLPLTDVDARELIDSIHMAPLLHGYRGSEPTDVKALEDLLLRIGRLADDIPELMEMDLNPVCVTPDGATVVDAKVRVAPHVSERPVGLRRLD